MSLELKYFLELSKCAIYNQDATSITPVHMNWENILQLARKHNMSALLYKTVSLLPENLRPSQVLLNRWKEEAFRYGLHQFGQNQEESLILAEAKKQGILCIPFKGLLLAELYPEPLMRTSGDADILVSPKDKDKMIEILVGRGYELDQRETTETVFTYERHGVLSVELHISLWEEYIGKRKTLLEQLDLTNPSTLIEVTACDIPFHTLGYEQHLIYQIYHMIKHFSLSGIGVRHLTDLTLYVNRYYDRINFADFWNTMEMLNYSVCCSYFFKICVGCFGMRKEAMKGSKIKTNIDLEPLIEDIIDGGVFGNSSTERFHARNIIKPYLNNQKKIELKKSRLVIGIIFPGNETLKSQYPYAKKHGILLPFAWIQRNCYLLKKHFGKSKESYGDKTLEQAKYRLKLLKELEIINK